MSSAIVAHQIEAFFSKANTWASSVLATPVINSLHRVLHIQMSFISKKTQKHSQKLSTPNQGRSISTPTKVCESSRLMKNTRTTILQEQVASPKTNYAVRLNSEALTTE
ncbi:hypothetical protein CRM22_007550 [Opisthorchis felineus]|uniref:Uncharacterized protein n=1 Tax=Opisthorchis felineus TaxID=147828 RepID=A0A4S2LFA0_OPIFE|nr:hypothetical protein CRM22_007550 [Opisthorchis felineus]